MGEIEQGIREILDVVRDLRADIATKDAEIKRLEAENERMAKGLWAAKTFIAHFENTAGCYLRTDVVSEAINAALSPIPDPAGGMPVEVET